MRLETGLMKLCARCHRIGIVWYEATGDIIIAWGGRKLRAYSPSPEEAKVSLTTLLNSELHCGCADAEI